jgi:hypothetical protein
MNQEHIIKQLNEWMVEFLEKPDPLLGNWPPCPYARQARINNKIDIRFSGVDDLTTSINNSLPVLEEKDVVIICFDHNKIEPKELQKFVKEQNETLLPKNYVILEDHPYAVEFVNGLLMNFNYCGLLRIQKAYKIKHASEQLKSKGYYDVWGQQELDDVVNWR